MRSIAARPAPWLLPFIALVSVASWVSTAHADARLETIYARYAPMFRYWCLSAEQRYAYEQPMPGRLSNRNSRTATCERLAAIYSDRLKQLASAGIEAGDDKVIEMVQFVGQTCIDMQMIGTGRARAEGACPLADQPENDMGARIEEVFGPHALQNYHKQFEKLGRRHLLGMFPPGWRATALTDYLASHGYRCRSDQTRMITQYRCFAQYDELIYEMFHGSMLVSYLPSVTYHTRNDGRLDDIAVSRFDEGLAVFRPYPE